ncbi:hypothetical protein [Tsuneonella rigui]|uniref:hypothetical protein n=1 Tax=Tsuneonella rigui TaxID=1708790 RepID=UPI0013E0E912|nr:hypothetical protein [Tsuneonella rigui]
MRMLMLGAASLALAASATYADPGKGNGGGNGGGHGGGHAAAGPALKGGGNGNGGGKGQGQDRSGPQMNAKADKGQARTAQAQARGPERKAERVVAQGNDRGNGNGNGNGKGRQDVVRSVDRDNVRVVREVREVRGNGGRDDVRVVRTVGFDDRGLRGLIDGCPPGLAKKNNGCQPPGLAKQNGTYRGGYYSPSWFGYSSLGDGRYYYDDGYLYRTNNTGSVLGYLPLLGGALSVGNPWPSYYDPYPVPDYYVDYYNLGAPNSYRYADDVLYRVDPQSNAITSIAALLTGDQFAVGQRMPLGYDVYNVPYAYRDQYLDGPDAYYRYADGYVYEVDPTTQLIQAAIQLLT